MSWFGVRCLFASSAEDDPGDHPASYYEERVTVWRAASLEVAIDLAEAEAEEYAGDTGSTYLRLAQAYLIGEEEPRRGSEVFSLVRRSALPPEEYVSRFFATGSEIIAS